MFARQVTTKLRLCAAAELTPIAESEIIPILPTGYPEVLKAQANVIEGVPKVRTFTSSSPRSTGPFTGKLS
jgi:hypothetical protein